MNLKQGCWTTALDFKLFTATWICLKRESSKCMHFQRASHGLRLKTSVSKASSFLKPLSGKSWAACHRAMEFSAVTPTAQHFPTSESRTNQSLFNSAQCNPSLSAQSPEAVLQHCWGQEIPHCSLIAVRSSIPLPLKSSFSEGPTNARSVPAKLLWGDGKVTP